MKLTIFFSWQSTTNEKYNKRFILKCIDKAIKRLEKQRGFDGIEFEIQEGIRGESGSVQVAETIANERIPNCDIFIADLSVVNAVSRFAKYVLNLTGHKHIPSINNNVIYEYSIAEQVLSERKIIGVSNSYYGSVKNDAQNIPFDIRHKRFPIEYKYSYKTKDIERVHTNFINDLYNAIKTTTEYAINHQRTKYQPLVPWSEWEKHIQIAHNFIANDKIMQLRDELTNFVTGARKNFRIIGLPGIGKTRLLFEIFRENVDDELSKFTSARVLYSNFNDYATYDFRTLLQKIIDDKESRIIILDNCPKKLHRNLKTLVERSDSKISLITVDSNPEEIHDKIDDVEYFIIKKEEFKDVADKIIENEVTLIGPENLERVKEFAQGNSLMATLLIKNIKSGEKIVGKLGDKDLLDRLLGEKGTAPKNRTILRSCSIFSYIGFQDDQKEQIDFIATNKNITSLDDSDTVLKEDFLALCQFYIKREIIEQRGRYIGIRPLPLAMYLAQEWMETCTDEKFLGVITDIAGLPDQHRKRLSEAFAEQMKYLGYDDKAAQIVGDIVGEDGPFDNAEVLNTELGSRLFRSFVEVNPIAISENLYRNFINKSTTELLNIQQGRRNLIWTLEKLCFDNRTFKKSALILFKFAAAENENISNNATGQFLQLFNIQLPGTEANLSERLNIINWGLEKNDEKFKKLSLNALGVGLKCRDFRRMGGAEHQGTKILKDYEPTYSEVGKYFQEIIALLNNIYDNHTGSRDKIEEIVLNRVRGLCREGLGMLILPFMEKIASNKHLNWQAGLNSLRLIKNYDSDFIDDDTCLKVDQLINLLTKDDFLGKFLDSQRYHSRRISFDETSKKLMQAARDLADEFLDNAVEWNQVFPALFSKNDGIPGFYFGKHLFEKYGENVEQKWEFIEAALDALSKIPKDNRNISIIIGFLADADYEVFIKIRDKLLKNNELNDMLFEILGNRKINVDELNPLFSLIESGQSKISNLSLVRSIRLFTVEEIEEFTKRLFNYGKEGYETAFHILFDYSFDDETKKRRVTDLFKKCYSELGVSWVYQTNMDYYKWYSTLTDILKNEKDSEFAEEVSKSFIDSIDGYKSFTWEHNVIGLYYTLMEFHFNVVWPYISEILLLSEKDYDKYHALTSILESNISATKDMSHIGVLFRGDIEKIFDWCHANSPSAPIIIAELTPIFDGNNDDFNNWHPIATRLINEFGSIQSVLNNISANMGSYSWIGSVVPYLKVQKALFVQLTNHPIPEVSEWANAHIRYLDKDIKRERARDEEESLR